MARGAYDRSVAAAVLLMAITAWTAGGYCPMATTGSAEGQGGSHDCCRRGISDEAPGCCHAGGAEIVAATVKMAPKLESLPAAAIVSATRMVTDEIALIGGSHRLSPAYSPPHTVLRI